MKSSLDLALERSGGALQKLDGKTKAAIAEIESTYKARIVALELATEERLNAAADVEAREKIQAGILAEIASLRERCEREKAALRN
jgi:hypothetical protein